jgi:hypothetical protein
MLDVHVAIMAGHQFMLYCKGALKPSLGLAAEVCRFSLDAVTVVVL